MSSRKFAILIGNSDFEVGSDLERLRCPPNDVEGLQEVLEDNNCGDFEEVIPLKEKNSNQIIVEINKLYERTNPGDLVLLYYSGHGKLDRPGQLYLAAADTHSSLLISTGLAIKRLIDIMRNYGLVNTVLVLDCCFSGAVEDYVYRGSVTDQIIADNPGHGTFIMASSSKHQVAREAKFGSKYGVFTEHFIHGLKSGAADRNNDGYIGVQELFKYVHEKVTSSSDQLPIKVDKISSGELYLAKTEQNLRKNRKTILRQKLLDWAGEDLITNLAVSESLNLLDVTTKAQVPIEKRWIDDLLDDLFRKNLSVASFNTQWLTQNTPTGSNYDNSDSKSNLTEFFLLPPKHVISETLYCAIWSLGCGLLTLYAIPSAASVEFPPTFLGLPAIIFGTAITFISGTLIVALRRQKLTSLSMVVYGTVTLLSLLIIFSFAALYQFGSPLPGILTSGVLGALIGYPILKNLDSPILNKS